MDRKQAEKEKWMTRCAADGTPLRSWRVGNVTITRMDEISFLSPPEHMFHGGSRDVVARNAWLKPHFADDENQLWMSFHSFVVESEGKRIIVDTCMGNDKPRSFFGMMQTPYLDNLEAAGFAPDSIDYVLCTHLHVDHVGWNTRLVDGLWVPTFTKARYLFGRVEWESFGASPDESGGDILGDSIQPVIDAGLSDFVETDHRITGEVRLTPTPGHTPGHVSVLISSGGEEAAITGDMIHHPVQCAEPELSSMFDGDSARARATREVFLSDCCSRGTMVLGSHFVDPTAGWIVPGETLYRFAVDRPVTAES